MKTFQEGRVLVCIAEHIRLAGLGDKRQNNFQSPALHEHLYLKGLISHVTELSDEENRAFHCTHVQNL